VILRPLALHVPLRLVNVLTKGVVRAWNADEGWGVVDSVETPGGCWVHFSNVDVTGFRSLHVGESVNLAWEAYEQDEFLFRALSVKRG